MRLAAWRTIASQARDGRRVLEQALCWAGAEGMENLLGPGLPDGSEIL